MKVLIVGSKSIHIATFITALNKQSYIPFLLSEEPLDYIEIKDNFVVNFRSLNPVSIFKNYLKLKQIILKMQPDVIHIHQINRLAYFVAKIAVKNHIHCLSTSWGSDVLIIPQQNSFFRFLVKKTLQRSRFVTADSVNMINEMQKLVPSNDKYIHLQYGIDLIEPSEKEKIIYSNRLHHPLYRIDKIIDYFAEVSTELPQWKLVIAATGSETEKLKEQVVQAGLSEQVKFVGWVEKDDNFAWYKKATIYISIPQSDGTSVSLLEAMSAGCIPIVPNLKVSKEWIQNSENGVIENGVDNPIRVAMKLNAEKCKEFNIQLIKQQAIRKECTAKFIQLYKSK